MNKFKGTPGPWEFDDSTGKVRADTLDCVVDTCSSSVSPCDLVLDDNNGLLIAAAPDLLEALQHVLNVKNAQEWGTYGAEINYKKLEAAITKALGTNK